MAKKTNDNESNSSRMYGTTSSARSKKRLCCIPLSDNTQYSLPLLERVRSGKIPFRSLEGIIEENLDDTALPSPVQIYGSDDKFLLRRSVLPAVSMSVSDDSIKSRNDLFVVSDEEHCRLSEEEILEEENSKNTKEHSITGIEVPPLPAPSQRIHTLEESTDKYDIMVDIDIYHPQHLPNKEVMCEHQQQEQGDQCACHNHLFYQGDWERRHHQTINHNQSRPHSNTESTPNNTTNINNNTNTNTNTENGDCAYQKSYNKTDRSVHKQPTMQLIDLTFLQTARRHGQIKDAPYHLQPGSCTSHRKSETETETETLKLKMDTPGRVFHILRSILSCPIGGSHCASPWKGSYTSKHNKHMPESTHECTTNNQVIAILLNGHPSDESADINRTHIDDASHHYFDALEQTEINQFLRFRTGDASPSYYLYSYAALHNGSHVINTLLQHTQHDFDPATHPATATGIGDDRNDIDRNAVTLLIYNHIPHRKHLSSAPPQFVKCQQSPPQLLKGCLWEEFQRLVAPHSSSLLSLSSSSKKNHSSNKNDTNVSLPSSFELVHRIVAPPYLLHTDIYPGLLDHFLTPDNLAAMIQEATTIPQWTAWPETTHYQSHNTNDNNNNENNSKPPASWSVFPLCHTFPATDPRNRQWIPVTCNYVPRTTQLLKQIGAPLRTALFSRLEPGTTLGAHRGWADLANHVLRLHIPLVVPTSSFHNNDHEGDNHTNKSRRRPRTAEGLCGAWVDGCTETHREGEILCFDDSKIHRAFNYNPSLERVVLIVDLARPNTTEKGEEENFAFPNGTSTGAHTDELDKFIKQFV